MNLKAIKTKTQENITTVIKSMVNENVTVQVNYDFEKEIVSLLLVEENKQEETLERIIVYSCVYGVEQKTLVSLDVSHTITSVSHSSITNL